MLDDLPRYSTKMIYQNILRTWPIYMIYFEMMYWDNLPRLSTLRCNRMMIYREMFYRYVLPEWPILIIDQDDLCYLENLPKLSIEVMVNGKYIYYYPRNSNSFYFLGSFELNVSSSYKLIIPSGSRVAGGCSTFEFTCPQAV